MAVWPTSAEDLMKVNKELQEENKRLQKSLRDQFAMAALNAMIQTSALPSWHFNDSDSAYISENAYALADSMLKARDKERE